MLESRAIAKAPEGEGCPRCGGYVYAAEQMLARGRVSLSCPVIVYPRCMREETASAELSFGVQGADLGINSLGLWFSRYLKCNNGNAVVVVVEDVGIIIQAK